MTRASMSIGYTKILGVKPHLDCHFHSKSYRIILNNHETSSEMFGLWAMYVTTYVKSSQFFTTTSTYDIMTSCQTS